MTEQDHSDVFPRLDDLLCGRKLWQPWAPPHVRIKQMKKVLEEVRVEHQAHLDDDRACRIDTGVLLGAMKLIEGLLKKKDEK